MNILILNAGSSSIKYQLIQMPSEKVICQGIIERIGDKNAIFKYKTQHVSKEEITTIASHKIGLEKLTSFLLHKEYGVIPNSDAITIVGHRVVHGGNSFAKTTVITKEVKDKIKELSTLAPLHNPANLEGIILSEQFFKAAKQIAVFDTAFHQSIPTKANKYAIPDSLYKKHGIQVYGFHGTSHRYVSKKAITYLNKPNSKLISIHLGNGCSITAIENGKSIDTSLGFTPANGLVMGTRSGDIDHSLIFYLVDTLGYSLGQVNQLLLKESGLKGLTGYSDLRDIEKEAKNNNQDCQLALEISAYRIKKYIGAYAVALNGLDAIIFTGGIGENSKTMRAMICSKMDFIGISIDEEKNKSISKDIENIAKKKAAVQVLVIPTNEELEIAQQAYQITL